MNTAIENTNVKAPVKLYCRSAKRSVTCMNADSLYYVAILDRIAQNAGERWITYHPGGNKDSKGRHLQIDDSGTVTKGPKALVGGKVGEIGQRFKGEKGKEQPAKPEQGDYDAEFERISKADAESALKGIQSGEDKLLIDYFDNTEYYGPLYQDYHAAKINDAYLKENGLSNLTDAQKRRLDTLRYTDFYTTTAKQYKQMMDNALREGESTDAEIADDLMALDRESEYDGYRISREEYLDAYKKTGSVQSARKYVRDEADKSEIKEYYEKLKDYKRRLEKYSKSPGKYYDAIQMQKAIAQMQNSIAAAKSRIENRQIKESTSASPFAR